MKFTRLRTVLNNGNEDSDRSIANRYERNALALSAE
jgi:hypothetical protein